MRLNIEFKTEREDKQMKLNDKLNLNLQFFADNDEVDLDKVMIRSQKTIAIKSKKHIQGAK